MNKNEDYNTPVQAWQFLLDNTLDNTLNVWAERFYGLQSRNFYFIGCIVNSFLTNSTAFFSHFVLVRIDADSN